MDDEKQKKAPLKSLPGKVPGMRHGRPMGQYRQKKVNKFEKNYRKIYEMTRKWALLNATQSEIARRLRTDLRILQRNLAIGKSHIDGGVPSLYATYYKSYHRWKEEGRQRAEQAKIKAAEETLDDLVKGKEVQVTEQYEVNAKGEMVGNKIIRKKSIPKNLDAAKFLLQNRDAENWGEGNKMKLEISHTGINSPSLTVDEWTARYGGKSPKVIDAEIIEDKKIEAKE